MGGLGNQLFQIFTTMEYAFKNGYEFVFTDETVLNTGISRKTYWNSFLGCLKAHTSKINNSKFNFKVYKEPDFTYHDLPDNGNDIKLAGYFQSPKYFSEYCSDIRDYLEIDDCCESTKSKYGQYIGDVALHFRIGDFVNHKEHPVMPVEYYVRALQHIIDTDKSVKRIIVFYQPCDKLLVEEKVQQLKQLKLFELEYIMVSTDVEDWEQMLLISLCNHKVIANSTFSWWGAYLGKGEGIICYPELWFGTDIDTKDLFPDHWAKIPLKK